MCRSKRIAMFEFEGRTWRALACVQGVVGGQVLLIATSVLLLTICTSAATSRQLPVFPLVGLLFAITFAMPKTQNGLLLLPWMAPSGL
jgi:hypothetical protein